MTWSRSGIWSFGFSPPVVDGGAVPAMDGSAVPVVEGNAVDGPVSEGGSGGGLGFTRILEQLRLDRCSGLCETCGEATLSFHR